MAIPSFDLIDVIRTIQKRKGFIAIIVIICLVLAGVFCVVKKKKYKAEARFLVNNPIYADRGNLFRNRDTRYVDYFGGDDDIDKVTALAYSDTVVDRIIRTSDFHIIYNMDMNTPKGYAALMTIFKKNFNIKRSEYKDLEVSYIAYDAQTAANVTNNCVTVIEETYRHIYESTKDNIKTSIGAKVMELNRSIDSLTDSLANMRDRYGIYSILSPTRHNTISGEMKGGGKGYGKAIEEVQNLESIKDQMVSDRANYLSAMNEFSASANSSMSLLKVITRAMPPANPTGLSTGMILAIAGCLGLFFSLLYVLVMEYFRRLNAVIR